MKRELVSLQSYKINVGNDKPPKVVPATELYKFYRFQEIAPAALVSSGHQGTNMDSKHEIFQEITKALEKAWGFQKTDEDKLSSGYFYYGTLTKTQEMRNSIPRFSST